MELNILVYESFVSYFAFHLHMVTDAIVPFFAAFSDGGITYFQAVDTIHTCHVSTTCKFSFLTVRMENYCNSMIVVEIFSWSF